jgi:hypothetical protein
MRCNFNKEIRMEKMNVKPATGKLGVLCVDWALLLQLL